MKDIFLALINNGPMILTALGTILTAYWAYKAQKQSTANGVALKANAEELMKRI